VQDPKRGRPRKLSIQHSAKTHEDAESESVSEEELNEMDRGYIDLERQSSLESLRKGTAVSPSMEKDGENGKQREPTTKEMDLKQGRVVDVVLSDMCAPWDLVDGFNKHSISDPYYRMMNTSGMAFRDHAGSMVSLSFSIDGDFDCLDYAHLELTKRADET
jgi:21S rRNA (uridine2791-2'-O)-methyltransferase